MATIAELSEQAQLSVAAYALNLQAGMSGKNDSAYISALTDSTVGMSVKQAEIFADTYSVVDQHTDPSRIARGIVLEMSIVAWNARPPKRRGGPDVAKECSMTSTSDARHKHETRTE